jgi:tetratricopeptide (TPR) repeat protein
VGTDIASFIGRHDVKTMFENHTREQIDLGKTLADQLKSGGGSAMAALRDAVDALINRDEGWKAAHRERMDGAARTTRSGSDLTATEKVALGERQGWLLAKAGNSQGAFQTTQALIDGLDLHATQRAELLYRMGAYINAFDPARALEMYRAAFRLNSNFPRPLQLPDRRYSHSHTQAVNVRDYLQSFTNANAAIARLEELKARLTFAGRPDTVEGALLELGEVLGATASRPERETGRGPDVLWIFDDVVFCIEAKSQKVSKVHKSDAEQLLLSVEWCRTNCEVQNIRLIPVFATDIPIADRSEDISFGPAALSSAAIGSLLDKLHAVVTAVTFDGPLFSDPVAIERHLIQLKLRGADIADALPGVAAA